MRPTVFTSRTFRVAFGTRTAFIFAAGAALGAVPGTTLTPAAEVRATSPRAAHPAPAGTRAEDWAELARRFTGESDSVREMAIRKLRGIPDLEQRLRKELTVSLWGGARRFLALDVISTLKLRALLPELMLLLPEDGTGYTVHAINSLIVPGNQAPGNQAGIRTLYHQILLRPETAAATKMALLDSLLRLQHHLEERELARLLQDPAFEVRATALAYLRHFLLHSDRTEYAPLVELALEPGGPYQLRAQALHLVAELPPRLKRQLRRHLETCDQDPSSEIRQLCGTLGRSK